MTTAVKAGHLLMAEIFCTRLDEETTTYLKAFEVKAVCLFRRNIESEAQLTRLCADLSALMGPDALIAIDQEGGGVVRTSFWAFPPSALCLGAADDVALTEQVAQANARFLRSVGINWNFAPVLDVNVNPHNPVIGDRAFGSDPEQVAAHGLAYARGLEAAGVAACAKHFPGHGDTHLDSHLELPTVNRPRPELEQTELLPFRRAVQDGISAIMTAHIVFPALDETLPATLSHAVLTGLLRREWGYEGVIITDSMGMLAIDSHYGRGEAGVAALQAGADMLMALGPISAQIRTLDAVQAALDDGSYDPAPSLARLRRLAAQFPAQIRPQPERGADTLLFERAWGRGLCQIGAVQRPAPGSRALLVVRREEAERNVSEAGLSADQVVTALGGLYALQLHSYDDPAQLDWPALRAQADAAGAALLLATTGRLRADFDFEGVRPDLHLCLWNPYAVLDVPAPALVTYGYQPEALAALHAFLSGHAEATGRLPLAGLER
ncbi:beta-N-acetylhexosaminidase (plasmid) [Deinococcus sp. KNUC1210]|uniref:beta-N-acetylhexosaminidase n=1 Tax=Deinococcus sp. KNUC1210 TaxID=2917691 RepID=UPI001EF11CD9|nr:beta-N-acetylhexosaminidase [Deinococcus sp. KNUC1210]ULH14203.1 beta-N-acetylhexosaminidase [Deinococcus sp. KNUC1210]